MKRPFHILAPLIVITSSLTSFSARAQSLRETLSKEAPNVCVWVLAPLEQTVPSDIRQNLTYLREELLDEGKSAPTTGAASYKLASTLCDQLIATLDERDQTAVRAGYRDAQAEANTKVTSRSLEVMRNYKMSWPQYARERDERSEIERQQGNNVSLAKASVRVDWAKRVTVLQRGLDNSYKQYREALREDANFQKPVSTATNSSTTNKDTYVTELSKLQKKYMAAGNLAAANEIEKKIAKATPEPMLTGDATIRAKLEDTSWKLDGSTKIMTFRADGKLYKSWGRLNPIWSVKNDTVYVEDSKINIDSRCESMMVSGGEKAGKWIRLNSK